jgi:hypothetical protein
MFNARPHTGKSEFCDKQQVTDQNCTPSATSTYPTTESTESTKRHKAQEALIAKNKALTEQVEQLTGTVAKQQAHINELLAIIGLFVEHNRQNPKTAPIAVSDFWKQEPKLFVARPEESNTAHNPRKRKAQTEPSPRPDARIIKDVIEGQGNPAHTTAHLSMRPKQ